MTPPTQPAATDSSSVPDDGAAERAERAARRLHGRHVRRGEQGDLGLCRGGDGAAAAATVVAAGRGRSICNTINKVPARNQKCSLDR